MIDISEGVKVQGIFKVEKYKEDGTVTYTGPEFNNLVLNTGLQACFSVQLREFLNRLCIGDSDIAPDISQASLQSYRYQSSTSFNSQEGSISSLFSDRPLWHGGYKVFNFPIGTCTGSFKELGLCRDNNSRFFNRTLFKDAQGNPTTITVGADEGMRIRCELRMYMDNTINPFSEILEIDLKGATSGSIVFSNGIASASFNTVLFAAATFGSYQLSMFLNENLFNNTNVAMFTTYDSVTKKAKVYANPGNKNSLNLSIVSNTLVGSTEAPTITVLQAFVPPIKKSMPHQNITTGITTDINYWIYPAYPTTFSTSEADPSSWGYGAERSFINYYCSCYGFPGPSSHADIITPTLSPLLLENTRKTYWAPGKLGSGSKNVQKFFIGPFAIEFETPITVTDVEDFEITYKYTWGRYTP